MPDALGASASSAYGEHVARTRQPKGAAAHLPAARAPQVHFDVLAPRSYSSRVSDRRAPSAPLAKARLGLLVHRASHELVVVETEDIELS
eukprot:2694973-Heterocapsa_arctica.AAC.1